MRTISLAAAVMLLSVSTIQVESTLLQHRHSFFPSLPVEPTDDNLKVSRHQVQVIGLDGFREWEVKGSLERILSPDVVPYKASAEKADSVALEDNTSVGSVHVQWFNGKGPLLRPPFTPTFVPGFHLAISSKGFEETWKGLCPVLDELVGGVYCKDVDPAQEATSKTTVHAKDLVPLYYHHYLHRTVAPAGFLSSASILSSLISSQQSGASFESGPALIDLVLHPSITTTNTIDFKLKVVWPVGGGGTGKNSKNQTGQKSQGDPKNIVTVRFDATTDSVSEVGYFYREVTEKEHLQYDHFLGATVRMDNQGEVVGEALVLARSPVFPPHKRNFSSGEIKAFGHGFTSKMTPPQTFHPHSVTTIRSNPLIAKTTDGCDLNVLQVLPAGVFVDPFQLEGLAPEIGKAVVFGETDLEKPVGVVPGWGSLVMVKVWPEESTKTSRWARISNEDETIDMDTKKNVNATEPYFTATVDIPMHMRYQPPVSKEDPATHTQVAVPWPVVAWTCPRAEPDEAADKRLFQITPLPLSLLFRKSLTEADQETVDFRYVLPDPIPKQYPEATVSVPVGRLEDMETVRAATFALAAVGTIMVAWSLVKAVSSRQAGKGKQD